MHSIPPKAPATPIAIPDVDSEVPVVVIPVASVAPLDGPADGERINTFALAPRIGAPASEGFGELRTRVMEKPLTYVAMAFSLGLLVGRLTR